MYLLTIGTMIEMFMWDVIYFFHRLDGIVEKSSKLDGQIFSILNKQMKS